MINKIKSLLRRKPKFIAENKHRIVEAFECGGIQYFWFEDTLNAPYERALSALTYYEEFRMRCTREYLQLHVKAVDDILGNPKKIDIGKLALIHQQMKQRLDWVIEPDMIYKLASVVFFDHTESPYTFDYQYSHKKIQHWKKHKEMHAFFLQTPLIKLLPFLLDCELNFQSYSKVLTEMNSLHLGNLLSALSEDSKRSAAVSDIISRMEMPAE